MREEWQMTHLGDRRMWSVAVGAATLLWLIGVGWYLGSFIGSDALAGMLPHEHGMLVAGIVAPVLLLWLLVAFLARGQALKEHTELLASRLAELTFPDQSAEHRVNSIAESLRRQAVDLRLATEEAAAALDGTLALFRSQASDIDTAAKSARARSEEFESTLAEQRRILGEMAGLVEKQREGLSQTGRDQAAAMGAAAEESARHITEVLDKKRAEIAAVIDRVLDHGSSVRDAVETQADRLGDQVEQAIGRFREQMAELVGRIDQATETSRHETRTMIQTTEAAQREFAAHAETLSVQLRGSTKQMSGQLTRLAEQAVAAAEKCAADNATLEQTSRAQVDRLSAAAGAAGEQFRQTFERLAQDLGAMTRSVSDGVSEKQQAIRVALEDHSRQLEGAFERLTANVGAMSQSVSDGVGEKQQALHAALTDHIKQLDSAFERLTANVGTMAQSASDRLGERQQSISAALSEQGK